MKRSVIASFVFLLAFASAAFAVDRTVPSGGDLEAVLSAAKDGDTIIVQDKAMVNDAADTLGGTPLVIDKSVTIKGATASSYIQHRRGGIIIGKDVTFKDIVLSFENKRTPAIFANGNTLTLDGVTCLSGSRKIHVFAGGWVDKYYGSTLKVPQAGTHGKIVVKGATCLNGSFYLGSMNTTFAGDATIEFASTSKSFSEAFTIWSTGARETPEMGDWFGAADLAPPSVDDYATFATTGAVTITVDDPSSRLSIDACTGKDRGADVTVIASGYSINGLRVDDAGSIKVVGNVKFGENSSVPDGVALSVPAGSELDLSGLSLPTVSTFDGGGTIIIAEGETLEITGDVTGTTAFKTPAYGAASGSVTAGHTYISATKSKESSFTFTPSSAQSGYTLKRDKNGDWIAQGPSTPAVRPKVSSFTFGQSSSSITAADANALGGARLGFSYVLNADDPMYEMADTRIDFTIKGGGKTWYANGMKRSNDDPYYVAYSKDAHMEFEWLTDHDGDGTTGVLLITKYNGDIEPGEYEIEATVPYSFTSKGDIKAKHTLTVTPNPQDPPSGGDKDPQDPPSGGDKDPQDPPSGGDKDPQDPPSGGDKDPQDPPSPQNPPTGSGGQDPSDPPSSGGGQGTQTPPSGGGDQGSQTPPSGGGDQGSQTPPSGGGDQGSQTPPSGGGDQGSQTPPSSGGGQGSATPDVPAYGSLPDIYSGYFVSTSHKTWSVRTGGDMTLRINIEYTRFTGVIFLDGRRLIEGIDFTSREGSTIIEIMSAALSKIKTNGAHEIAVAFDDGVAKHNFVVRDVSSTQTDRGGGTSSSSSSACTAGAAALIPLALLALRRSRR